MSKFTLASLALLCLLLSSCAKQEMNPDTYDDTALALRSADAILVKFNLVTGAELSYFCTEVEVDYHNSSSATIELHFSDSTTLTHTGSNVTLSAAEGYDLSVIAGGGTAVEVSNLSITNCGITLCYEENTDAFSGQALDFIVEDVDNGF